MQNQQQQKKKLFSTKINSTSIFQKSVYFPLNRFQIPNFINIQLLSFQSFLKEGLIVEFQKFNKVQNSKQTLQIFIYAEHYKLNRPKWTPKQAILKKKSYSCELYVPVQLLNKKSESIKLQWVLFAHLPLMTKHGHFIVNGCPRVLMNQMVRSPGVYFKIIEKKNRETIYCADFIAQRGSWLRLEIDTKKGNIWAKLKKTPKIPVLTFLQALGLSLPVLSQNIDFAKWRYLMPLKQVKQSSKIFKNEIEIPLTNSVNAKKLKTIFTNFKFQKKHAYLKTCQKYWHNLGAFYKKQEKYTFRQKLLELVKKGQIKVEDFKIGKLTPLKKPLRPIKPKKLWGKSKSIWKTYFQSLLALEKQVYLSDVKVINFQTKSQVEEVNQTLAKQPLKFGKALFLKTIHQSTKVKYLAKAKVKKKDRERAQKFLFKKFQNPRTYDLSLLGRTRLNQKLGLNIDLSYTLLTAQDILAACLILMDLLQGSIISDDIDDLKNRQINSSGNLIQLQLATGLIRFEKIIREKLKKNQLNSIEFSNLFTLKPINQCFREFFGSSPLSQLMDQTNALAEITHKRRLSSLGPGGINRENAGMAIRGIHPTHYGRICPIETPEGQNAGLVNSFTIYSHLNTKGFIETPFYQTYKGFIFKEKSPFLFSSDQEKNKVFVPGDIQSSLFNFLPSNVRIPSRQMNEFKKVSRNSVNFTSLSSLQMISVATSLIPFLEHDDGNRALMGSNMQRQAVPTFRPSKPIVGTGLESRVIANLGHNLQAHQSGFVSYVDGQKIILYSKKLPAQSFISDALFNIEKVKKNQKALPAQKLSRSSFDFSLEKRFLLVGKSALLPKLPDQSSRTKLDVMLSRSKFWGFFQKFGDRTAFFQNRLITKVVLPQTEKITFSLLNFKLFTKTKIFEINLKNYFVGKICFQTKITKNKTNTLFFRKSQENLSTTQSLFFEKKSKIKKKLFFAEKQVSRNFLFKKNLIKACKKIRYLKHSKSIFSFLKTLAFPSLKILNFKYNFQLYNKQNENLFAKAFVAKKNFRRQSYLLAQKLQQEQQKAASKNSLNSKHFYFLSNQIFLNDFFGQLKLLIFFYNNLNKSQVLQKKHKLFFSKYFLVFLNQLSHQKLLTLYCQIVLASFQKSSLLYFFNQDQKSIFFPIFTKNQFLSQFWVLNKFQRQFFKFENFKFEAKIQNFQKQNLITSPSVFSDIWNLTSLKKISSLQIRSGIFKKLKKVQGYSNFKKFYFANVKVNKIQNFSFFRSKTLTCSGQAALTMKLLRHQSFLKLFFKSLPKTMFAKHCLNSTKIAFVWLSSNTKILPFTLGSSSNKLDKKVCKNTFVLNTTKASLSTFLSKAATPTSFLKQFLLFASFQKPFNLNKTKFTKQIVKKPLQKFLENYFELSKKKQSKIFLTQNGLVFKIKLNQKIKSKELKKFLFFKQNLDFAFLSFLPSLKVAFAEKNQSYYRQSYFVAKTTILPKLLGRTKNTVTQKLLPYFLSASKRNQKLQQKTFESSTNNINKKLVDQFLSFVPFKYTLNTYHRSNQDTYMIHRPLVQEGQWVEKGDTLVDSSTSVQGELSIGQNLLVGYTPWEGYNFEDAVLISEKVVFSDFFTSLHIERYEVEVCDTEFGMEQITSQIPNKPANCNYLEANGLAKIGTWVEEGDILVGKIAPRGEKKLTPYENLLYAILDKELSKSRDTSLKVPKGVKGRVIHIEIVETNQKRKPIGTQNLKPPFISTFPNVKAKVQTKLKKNFSTFLTSENKVFFDFYLKRQSKSKAFALVKNLFNSEKKKTILTFAFPKQTFKLIKNLNENANFTSFCFQSQSSVFKNLVDAAVNREVGKVVPALMLCHQDFVRRLESHKPNGTTKAFMSTTSPGRLKVSLQQNYGKKKENFSQLRLPLTTSKSQFFQTGAFLKANFLKKFGWQFLWQRQKNSKQNLEKTFLTSQKSYFVGKNFLKKFFLNQKTFVTSHKNGCAAKKKFFKNFFLNQSIFFFKKILKKEQTLFQQKKKEIYKKIGEIKRFFLKKKLATTFLALGLKKKKAASQPFMLADFQSLNTFKSSKDFWQQKSQVFKPSLFFFVVFDSKKNFQQKEKTQANFQKIFKNSTKTYFSQIREKNSSQKKTALNESTALTGLKKVHVYLAVKRKLQVGDKIAGRHGNKGIISNILPRQDMPYLPDGTPLDIVLNPLGVPSRMNVGQIFECLLGLAGYYLKQNYKVQPFDEVYGCEASRSLVYSKLYEARLKTNQEWLFNPNFPGKVRLFDGRSGECFEQPVTVGVAYILKLIHLVEEKIHARSTGPYSLITQQPLRGRSKQGGQRVGEMEVWALEGFGAAYILQEILTLKSDDLKGRQQVLNSILTLKPFYAGIPESFKVLVRELQALCLDLSIYKNKKNQKGKIVSTSIDINYLQII